MLNVKRRIPKSSDKLSGNAKNNKKLNLPLAGIVQSLLAIAQIAKIANFLLFVSKQIQFQSLEEQVDFVKVIIIQALLGDAGVR